MTHFSLIKNKLAKHFFSKKLIFSIVFLFSFTMLNAQVIYNEIIPTQEATLDKSIPIDINMDGISDIELVYNYHDGYVNRDHRFSIITKNHSFVALENDSIARFNDQDMITSNLSWSNELENDLLLHRWHHIEEKVSIYGNWVDVKDGFVPLKLKLNDQYHYGWLRLHFINNLKLYAVDFAYNSIPNEVINAGDGYNNSISFILATDKSNYFNGKDIEVKFAGPLYSSMFSEYRFILAKANDETALDLTSMNQVPNDRYLSINDLQEDYVNSMILDGLYLDKNGDSIKKFTDYRVHVLNVASSGINSENKLSNPSNMFLLQAFVADVHKPTFNMSDSLIVLSDIQFNINDFGTNDFTKEFRAFIIPDEDINNFTIENALISNRSYSLNVPYSSNNIETSFSNDQLDINGNPVIEKEPYFIRILSVPDSVYAVQGKLSKESNRIMLNAPNFIQVGDTINPDINLFNWDYTFSDYEYWCGNSMGQSNADQDVDLNRDGIPDFFFSGLNWHHYGWAYFLELYPYRNNKVLLSNNENHENWIDVLNYNEVFGENYRWSNEYALLKWYESDGNGNYISLGLDIGDLY